MRRVLAGLTTVVALSVMTGPAFANAKAPTNGGNGGGRSGQCTGPASERPHGCHTYK